MSEQVFWLFVMFFANHIGLAACVGVSEYLRRDRLLRRLIRRTAKRIRKIDKQIKRLDQDIFLYRGKSFETRLIELVNRRIHVVSPKYLHAMQATHIPDVQEVEATRARFIESAEIKRNELRTQLPKEIVVWKRLVADYRTRYETRPAQKERVTYRTNPPRVRVEPVIEETEELLAYLERQVHTADS